MLTIAKPHTGWCQRDEHPNLEGGGPQLCATGKQDSMGGADVGDVRSPGVGQDGTAHKRKRLGQGGVGRTMDKGKIKHSSAPQVGVEIGNWTILDAGLEEKAGEVALATPPRRPLRISLTLLGRSCNNRTDETVRRVKRPLKAAL